MRVLDIALLPRPLHGTVEVRLFEALCTSDLWNADLLHKPTAMPTLSSNLSLLVETVTQFNTVRHFLDTWRALTDAWIVFEHTGYVGYDPNLHTVIVAHQGTDPSEM